MNDGLGSTPETDRQTDRHPIKVPRWTPVRLSAFFTTRISEENCSLIESIIFRSLIDESIERKRPGRGVGLPGTRASAGTGKSNLKVISRKTIFWGKFYCGNLGLRPLFRIETMQKGSAAGGVRPGQRERMR